MLYTVPRCSGGFTSAMSENQLGELADVNARATTAARNARAMVGFVTSEVNAYPMISMLDASAATPSFSGRRNRPT